VFLPHVCTDNFNFNIWANSCFSVSVRFSHFANPARNSGERTVGALARASVPSAAGVVAPVRRGERLREWARTATHVALRRCSSFIASPAPAPDGAGSACSGSAQSSNKPERKDLAVASAMRVDAPLSLRGYAEDDGDEDDVV